MPSDLHPPANPALDRMLAAFREDLSLPTAAKFMEVATDYLARASVGEGRVSSGLPLSKVAERFDEALPMGGSTIDDVLARVASEILTDANRLMHPMAMGHQVSAPLGAAIWADTITSALNQSLAVSEMSPTLTHVERCVVRWLSDVAGFGADGDGTLTSGGTEATLTALLAARNAMLGSSWREGVGANPPVLVCGEHTHYAVSRAAGELGIGTDNVVRISSRDYRMDCEALEKELAALDAAGRGVMAVVATAGSTATGSFDDLGRIGALCDQRGMWLHIDGTHGASALLSDRHRHRLRGVELARSLAWDPHKMMLLPLSAGVLLVRQRKDLERAFAQDAPYLFQGSRHDFVIDQGIRSFQCSRRADVLKLWVALQRYGADGIGAAYDRLCDLTMTLFHLLDAHPDFEALHLPECNILCFRYVGDGRITGDALDACNLRLRESYNRSGEGWITTTLLNGQRVLRVTIMNLLTNEDHLSHLIEGLSEEGKRVEQELS